MSLPGFAALRRSHPEEVQAVDRLEAEIASTLRQDPHAVIDHLILAQTVGLRRAEIGLMLAELVKQSVLAVRWFWVCPNTHATIQEADNEAEFPDSVECKHCGEVHQYDAADSEVAFLPTDEFRRALATSR